MQIRIQTLAVALALVATLTAPSAAQTQTPQPSGALRLAELVARAEQRNPTIAAARQTVAAAEAGVTLARAGWGITVSARGSTGLSGGTAATDENRFTSSAALAASYTLYDGGKTAYAVQQAEATLRSARASLEAVRQDTALTVGLAYVGLLRAERSVALREQQVARNSELVRIAQGQFEAGVVARADVVSAQAGLAAAESELIAARNAVDLAKAALNVAIGGDPVAPIAAAPAPQVPVVTVTQPDLARLIEQRPEIQKAQADVQAADAAVRLTQAARGLQVALDGAATQTFAPNVQTAYSIGASVSFPLSDAGRAAAEVAQATASLQAARARLEAARLTALQGGVSALLNLNSAAGRIQSARASLALAEESLRLAQGRYAAGVVAIFAVTDAQTTVLEAEVALAGAEFDQVAGVLQLRHALGRSVVDGTI